MTQDFNTFSIFYRYHCGADFISFIKKDKKTLTRTLCTYCTLLLQLFSSVPANNTYYSSSLYKYKVMIKHLSFLYYSLSFLIYALTITCISHSAPLLILPRRCRKTFQSQEPLWSWATWALVLLATSLSCESSSLLPPHHPLSPRWAVCPRFMSAPLSKGGYTSGGILPGLVWSTGWSGTRRMFMVRRSGVSLMQLVGKIWNYSLMSFFFFHIWQQTFNFHAKYHKRKKVR